MAFIATNLQLLKSWNGYTQVLKSEHQLEQ